MNAPAEPNWDDVNRQYVMARIARVRLQLARLCRTGDDEGGTLERELAAIDERANEIAKVMTPAPALDHLCDAFSLSPFERDVVLLCAGAAIDPTFAALCAEAHHDSEAAYPTFLLAIAAFSGDRWTALTPAAPL